MPNGGFSIGKDISLSIITPSGPLTIGLITGFQSKQDVTKKKIKGLDGLNRPVRFFEGWSGSFDLDRQDSTVDAYFAQLEANYFGGLNENTVTITETITEANGSVTQWRYTGVLLELADAGAWKGDDTVKQKINFDAQRRFQVS